MAIGAVGGGGRGRGKDRSSSEIHGAGSMYKTLKNWMAKKKEENMRLSSGKDNRVTIA